MIVEEEDRYIGDTDVIKSGSPIYGVVIFMQCLVHKRVLKSIGLFHDSVNKSAHTIYVCTGQNTIVLPCWIKIILRETRVSNLKVIWVATHKLVFGLNKQ